MSENVQEKKSSKLVVILLIVLIVLVIGGVITAIVLLNKDKDDISADGEEAETSFTIGYHGQGVVALDEDEFKRIFEEMQREAEEGMIDLSYKNVAVSEDGVHFECELGNPISNRYDVYYNIYLNNDMDQQILLTGLIPPDSELSEFDSEIPLEPGEYTSTLVITQIEDDHATIHGQAYVVLNLIVTGDVMIDDSVFD